MIQFTLMNGDFANMRFAYSPVRELVASLRGLQDPQTRLVYGSWQSDSIRRLGGVKLNILTTLVPAGQYVPSFLTPPATKLWTDLSDELRIIAATPPAHVRLELERMTDGRPVPRLLRPLYEDPATQLLAIVDELEEYWKIAIGPIWHRLRALAAADLFYRTEQFATGGLVSVLQGLHSKITLRGDQLRIDAPRSCEHQYNLLGTGVTLIPCGFLWPGLIVDCCYTESPSLVYPVRGVADLLSEPRLEESDPLHALVGSTRAKLLTMLSLPQTTTQLAEDLNMTPAAISQHLKVLKGTGLASSRRRGRLVLYQRTPAATILLSNVGTSAV